MNTSEAIRARRSIRKYQPNAPIPREHIERLLEAAMMAPSACNTRPWSFAVVENMDMRRRIASTLRYAKHALTASLVIVVIGHPEKLAAALPPYWPQDCGAAIENLLLEATELGYGAGWCGVYPDEKNTAEIARILETKGLPLAVVTVGVPDESPAARGHFDPDRVRYYR